MSQRLVNRPGPANSVNDPARSGTSTPDPDKIFDVVLLLREQLRVLQELVQPGMCNTNIEYQTITTGAVAQVLYPNSKPVRSAVIQNLSSTESMTVFALAGAIGSAIQGTTMQGIVLNKAPSSTEAGGSVPFCNIDLGMVSVLATTGGHGYAVKYDW